VPTPRSLVTNFISGIRQRKWQQNLDQNNGNNSQSQSITKPSSFLSSLNIGATAIRNKLVIAFYDFIKYFQMSFLDILKLCLFKSPTQNTMPNVAFHNSATSFTANNDSNKKELNLEYLNAINNMDENSSISDIEEFKDMDSNEEKLFGTELFEDLPLNERRLKLEEQVTSWFFIFEN
jgi:hypothetical protein